eukprot:jgi/Mesen1/2495/ME000159S01615
MGLLRAILENPDEIISLIRVRYTVHLASRLPADPDLAFCYDMLNQVSRSFAVVIQQLDVQLRDAVCVFYLVLRALDTIEDDMTIPIATKLPLLHGFFQNISDPSWRFVCGTAHYRRLMESFDRLARAYTGLSTHYQATIADVTKQMGAGMAKFIEREVESVEDYDEYCHYVAGLVGLGLSDLFHAARLEEPAPPALSNAMGLLLQKTNIIRDYLEDIVEEPAPRMFWPRQIWSKYAARLEEFKDVDANGKRALGCLNEMVADALAHTGDSLAYLAQLRTPSVFRFCAIPQVRLFVCGDIRPPAAAAVSLVSCWAASLLTLSEASAAQIMAMGTLALCYNNEGVFCGVVKLRRGLSATIMDRTRSMEDVYVYFDRFAVELRDKVLVCALGLAYVLYQVTFHS